MKARSNQETKPYWDIDDTVYFLGETDRGLFPHVYKGTVEEIRRDCLRIKVPSDLSPEDTNFIWVDRGSCYKSMQVLASLLVNHLRDESVRVDRKEMIGVTNEKTSLYRIL